MTNETNLTNETEKPVELDWNSEMMKFYVALPVNTEAGDVPLHDAEPQASKEEAIQFINRNISFGETWVIYKCKPVQRVTLRFETEEL